MRILIALFTILLFGACTNENYVLHSPDNTLRVEVKLPVESNQHSFSFDVFRAEELISSGNKLGLELKSADGIFNTNLRLLSFRRFYINNLITENGQELKNNANGIRFMLANAEGRNLDVVFRIYNDAVAYQYELYNDSLDVLLNDFSAFDSDPENGILAVQLQDTIAETPTILSPNHVLPWKALLISRNSTSEIKSLKVRLRADAEFAY